MSPIPYTVPHTITAGELVTVATMNNEWGGNVTFLANPPSCRVTHNATQAVSDITFTKLAFNTETYDTGGMHDPVTNNSRITISTAGIYLVTFSGEYASANDYVVVYADIFLNNTTKLVEQRWHPNTAAADVRDVMLATQYKFAAADYIEVRAYQDNTANAARNILAAPPPVFAATWIGLG